MALLCSTPSSPALALRLAIAAAVLLNGLLDIAALDEQDGSKETSRMGREIHRDSTHPHPMLRTGEESSVDVAFQSCRTPYGEKGHCRHLRFCILDEFKNDFDRFRDYACVIEGKYIGVCCPDSRDILDKSRDFSTNWTIGRVPLQQGSSPMTLSASSRDVMQREGCGISRASSRSSTVAKVTGGSDTVPGEHPWMVALFRAGGQQFCGGVLLSSSHVLTAAHCVYNLLPSDLSVGLGEYDLSRPDEAVVQTFGIAEILVHERFNPEAYSDDIAVLLLSGSAQLTDYVRPICLPPQGIDDYSGEEATVIGWGTVYYGGPPSDVLMQVTVPVWTAEECKNRFDQPILDSELCAGTSEGGKDSCQGDSGGPLLLQLDDGRWCNIGIVSFGIRCGEPGKPGVYTRVSRYLDWIAQNTR